MYVSKYLTLTLLLLHQGKAESTRIILKHSFEIHHWNQTLEEFQQPVDAFVKYRNAFGLKILAGTAFISRFVLGNVCYATLIHYEKFGQDSLKRGLNNQLMAQVFYTLLISGITTRPLRAWSSIFGPIGQSAARWVMYGDGITMIVSLLFFCQVIIFKNLMLFNFSLSARLNEDFFATYLQIWNIGFALLAMASQAKVNGLPSKMYQFASGQCLEGTFTIYSIGDCTKYLNH